MTAPDPMTLIALNGLAVWAIQFLKGSKFFPWINGKTQAVNRIASSVAAALASAGMTITALHTGTVEAGTLTITYAGLTMSHLASFGYTAIGSFWAQKLMYKATQIGNGVAKAP